MLKMRLLFAVVVSTLSLISSASPVFRVGITVPFTRHVHFANGNGVSNATLLQSHLAAVQGKLRRGFEAFKQNTGIQHPSDNGHLHKRATGADKLTDDEGALWQGGISVGNPAKDFTGRRLTLNNI